METIDLKCVGFDILNEIEYKQDTIIRFEQTRKALKEQLPAKIGRVLCVGNENGFDKRMCDCFNVEYIHTSQDLNYQWNIAVGGIDYIFCFEVIEHLMNPLLFLEQLRKFNCPVVISHPYQPFTPLKGGAHFHEMSEIAFYTLVTEAGFEIQYHKSLINRRSLFQFPKTFKKLLARFFLAFGYPRIELYILKVQDGYKKD